METESHCGLSNADYASKAQLKGSMKIVTVAGLACKVRANFREDDALASQILLFKFAPFSLS